jgi:hypothetical protein
VREREKNEGEREAKKKKKILIDFYDMPRIFFSSLGTFFVAFFTDLWRTYGRERESGKIEQRE